MERSGAGSICGVGEDAVGGVPERAAVVESRGAGAGGARAGVSGVRAGGRGAGKRGGRGCLFYGGERAMAGDAGAGVGGVPAVADGSGDDGFVSGAVRPGRAVALSSGVRNVLWAVPDIWVGGCVDDSGRDLLPGVVGRGDGGGRVHVGGGWRWGWRCLRRSTSC